ncbi:DUF4351 domain-containing protein [Thiohalocapsa marina]|uniref:DUF4351 domain-containing protein n=1 Tax=Thiohalocapsa marina TaxID=424902 RepID=UPI00248239C5|nr:DUF4351 domain-containing protein [Thiohalocapsa marina]
MAATSAAHSRAFGLATGFAARFTEQGRQQGETHLVLRLLNRRVGSVPDAYRQRIESLPVDQIETLGEDLLDFTGPADLEAWLARH